MTNTHIDILLSIGDNKLISRERLEIKPPVLGDFKGYVDRLENAVYYMVEKSLLWFDLPEQALKHGGDSTAILKGESILDSEA